MTGEQENAAAGRRVSFVAAAAEAGQRIDRVLAGRLPALSRSRLKALIEEGCLKADGAALTQPSHKVRAGQSFAIFLPEARAPSPEAQPIPLTVIYEDADLIVIDKPPGMVVHPAPGNPDRTLVNALIAHCGASLTGVGGVRRPGIVHRLDKDTSGLMVAAKTEAAHQGLIAQFAGRSIERAYLCLVWGRPEPSSGEIVGNIGRDPRNRKKMDLLRHGGRAATTRYKTLKSFAGGAISLLECRLLTGRTHQIRVHLSAKGHPLVGDRLYGARAQRRARDLPPAAAAAVAAFPRQALHARSLGFRHPTSGRSHRFEILLPNDISDLIYTLERL
ncbi:MAG: RluA family pseudouridine synthase [Kiloniellales bacterium]